MPRPIPNWLLQLLTIAFHIIADLGIAFIAYGVITQTTGEGWPPLDRVAERLSATLTLVATGITAASVYTYGIPPPPPSDLGKWILAPAVLTAVAAAIWLVWFHLLPVIVVNGFAALGLAGALFRTVPRPFQPPLTMAAVRAE
jgi:hypothetical protein